MLKILGKGIDYSSNQVYSVFTVGMWFNRVGCGGGRAKPVAKKNGSSSGMKSINIKSKTFDKIKAYSDITGATLQFVVNRALEDWLDTVGTVHMEVLSNRASGKALLTAVAIPPASLEIQTQESGKPDLQA